MPSTPWHACDADARLQATLRPASLAVAGNSTPFELALRYCADPFLRSDLPSPPCAAWEPVRRTALQRMHERYVHLILVAANLDTFVHAHLVGDSGSDGDEEREDAPLRLEVAFPRAGRWAYQLEATLSASTLARCRSGSFSQALVPRGVATLTSQGTLPDDTRHAMCHGLLPNVPYRRRPANGWPKEQTQTHCHT